MEGEVAVLGPVGGKLVCAAFDEVYAINKKIFINFMNKINSSFNQWGH